jgi:nicotinamide riboside kinase
MSTLVQIFGGPSAGKSVLAAELYVVMKKANIGSVELIQEYAKELVWQERFNDLKDQSLVTAGQIAKTMPLNNKVDYLITDSPLLLGLVYAQDYKEVEETILSHTNQFERTVNVFVERGGASFETQGRVHNEQQSIELDKKIKDMLEKYGFEYLTVGRDDAAVVMQMV